MDEFEAMEAESRMEVRGVSAGVVKPLVELVAEQRGWYDGENKGGVE